MAGFRISEWDKLKEHRLLYKAKTPPWKEAFRARCFQRMRNTRGRLLDKFRHLGADNDKVIDEMMKEEWNSLCEEQELLPKLFIGDITEDFIDTEVNEFLSIFEEIQKELLEERMLLEKQYAESEVKSLECAIDWIEREEVICPICKKCPLHQLHSVIFCQCGLEIDTKQDGLTLGHVKQELYKGLETHEKTCSVSPTFLLVQYCDIKNLTITCDVCNFMYIII